MAGTEMSTIPTQRICALRLPGTSRARFVDAGLVQVALGDWVTIDTGPGEEPGQIVVEPDQWIEPVQMDDVPTIVRTLSDEDIETIASNIERARDLIGPAGDSIRKHQPGCFLCGLRLTLAGDAAIAIYIGDEPADRETLARHLSDVLELSVYLEQDQPGDPDQTLLGGSTGLPIRSRPQTFRELLEQRIDVIRELGTFAPHGIPRLGSAVQTPHGTGTLVSVDIRHWNATVRLNEGEEISLSVDSLSKP
jgi:cell fate regulator YaaT (PSP1 superfamily)